MYLCRLDIDRDRLVAMFHYQGSLRVSGTNMVVGSPRRSVMRGHFSSVERSQNASYTDGDLPAAAFPDRRPDRASDDAAEQNPKPLFHMIGLSRP